MHLVSRGDQSWVLALLALFGGAGLARAGDLPAAIYSGKALNDLLLKCQGRPSESPEPPPLLPVQARGACNILTRGGVDASVLLKASSTRVPPALTDARKERQRYATALSAVVKAPRKGKVPPKVVKELEAATAGLHTYLADRADELSPSQYIEAKRFLNRLQKAVRSINPATLGDDVALAERIARMRSVAGLVGVMKARKLQFAPALSWEGAAYQALYAALAAHQRTLAEPQRARPGH
jgi:hypothetical protein